ncbi:MAG: translesion DNA synthesis-associated protein ImuA [Aestuariibacter sp.]
MNNILDYLKNKHLVWQGHPTDTKQSVGSSGYAELDELLCGGFPQQGVIDIHSQLGIGEFRLLQPLLRARHQQQQNYLALIAPPFKLNAEMLAEAGLSLSRVLIIQSQSAQESLWAAEQCLKSGCCHSVLSWAKDLEVHQIKRLQLAAKQSQSLHFLFRPVALSRISLPVTLAMHLEPAPSGIEVTITKQIGGWQQQPRIVNMRAQWPAFTLADKNNVVPFSHKQAG